MKFFKNNNRKKMFKHIVIIMITIERVVCWLIDENKPPKIVKIITKLESKFKELSSGMPKG